MQRRRWRGSSGRPARRTGGCGGCWRSSPAATACSTTSSSKPSSSSNRYGKPKLALIRCGLIRVQSLLKRNGYGLHSSLPASQRVYLSCYQKDIISRSLNISVLLLYLNLNKKKIPREWSSQQSQTTDTLHSHTKKNRRS